MNPKTKKCCHKLAKALKAAFHGSKLTDLQAAQIIQSYLELDGQSLDRYLNPNAPGGKEFKEAVEAIKAEGTLILGTPGSVEHTQFKQKQARKRLSIVNPTGEDWVFYTSVSGHSREKPQKEKHEGLVNWVRVTLPEYDPPLFHPHKYDIETPIGWVRGVDHMAFSNEAVRRYVFQDSFPNGINQPGISQKLPDFKRVDLVTPARYDLIRFAPLSIYIGYEEVDSTTPLFYIMCGGNALGQSKVMYASSTDLDKEILQYSGYRPSPFSSADNFYLAQTKFDGMDPVAVTIKIFTEDEMEDFEENGNEHDEDFYHFILDMKMTKTTLEEVAGIDTFLPPTKQVLDAFLRIQELRNLGIPVDKATTLEKRITALQQRITKRASKGRKVACAERRLARLKKKQAEREAQEKEKA